MSKARGMGSVIKSGTGWIAQIQTPSGRKTHRTKSQREAREWLTMNRREMDTGTFVEPSDRLLCSWWAEWMQTYKRITTSDASMRAFLQSGQRLLKYAPELWDSQLLKIVPSMIQRAVSGLHDQGMSDRTCQLTLVHLKDCLNQAMIDGMLKINPAKNIKPPASHDVSPQRAKPLTNEEYDLLIEWCTKPLRIKADGSKDMNDFNSRNIRDLLLFIAQTGVRCGEAIALRWTDVHDKSATISKSIDIRGKESRTKTGTTRTVPLTPLVLAMMERRRFAGHEYVFSTRYGGPINHDTILREMKRKTGHTVHDLRHTYITRAARAGVNPRVLQTITGHRDISVLLTVYTHVSEDDKASAAEKITATSN